MSNKQQKESRTNSFHFKEDEDEMKMKILKHNVDLGSEEDDCKKPLLSAEHKKETS